jgi:hypothetical protein
VAKPTPNSVQQASNKLHRRYQNEYAGHARHTRSLEPIEMLIQKSERLIKQARKLKGQPGKDVLKVVLERFSLYRNERDAIAAAKFESPELRGARRTVRRADRAIQVYRRHFAGKSRQTRRPALLDALVATLADAKATLTPVVQSEKKLELTGALERVNSQLLLMGDEQGELKKVLDALDASEREARSLSLARDVFDSYRVHFAGHARASAEPDRLADLIARLDTIATDLAASAWASQNAVDYAALTDQRGEYAAELEAIQATHAEAHPRDVTGALGAAANDIFALYQDHFAGQSRSTRNPRLMSEMCDRLTSIHTQMEALQTRSDDPVNAKNLGVVEGRLATYEDEWAAIVAAKREANPERSGPDLRIDID